MLICAALRCVPSLALFASLTTLDPLALSFTARVETRRTSLGASSMFKRRMATGRAKW